jgi:hypothetical protein
MFPNLTTGADHSIDGSDRPALLGMTISPFFGAHGKMIDTEIENETYASFVWVIPCIVVGDAALAVDFTIPNFRLTDLLLARFKTILENRSAAVGLNHDAWRQHAITISESWHHGGKGNGWWSDHRIAAIPAVHPHFSEGATVIGIRKTSLNSGNDRPPAIAREAAAHIGAVSSEGFVLFQGVLAGGTDGADADYRKHPSARSEPKFKILPETASIWWRRTIAVTALVTISAIALFGANWLGGRYGGIGVPFSVILWLSCLWAFSWILDGLSL